MNIDQVTDDGLLASLVTAASRAIDRKCTGVGTPAAHNYFILESIVGENLPGRINADGEVICFPHKPVVLSVSSFTVRANITQPWTTVDAAARVEIMENKVKAYPLGIDWGYPYNWGNYPGKCRVQISYVGGFAVSGSPAALPEDLQECCTILAARFYREAETGLTDSIGVAELATLVYTKAWPIRVTEQLETFIRRVGWEYI